MIVEKVMEYKASKQEQWPITSNRASEMGHPCTRYLTYNRTSWQQKALPPPSLQLTFDIGNILEEAVLSDIKAAGFQVSNQQRAFEWKEYQITGTVDGLITIEGKSYPLEIKTASPYVFQAINTIDDLKNGKYLYLRKYPTQLNLYCLMKEVDKGCFIFKNKVNGQMKEIWMPIDYDLGEQTLKKAETVNEHVKAGTLPDRIEWSEDVCGQCAYSHLCLPEVNRKEMEIIDSSELVMMLERRADLAPPAKEYKELDEEIKEQVKGKEKLMVGDWFITGKTVAKKEYTVKASEYWSTTIKHI